VNGNTVVGEVTAVLYVSAVPNARNVVMLVLNATNRSLEAPPVAIKVWSGKNNASPGSQIEGATVRIEDEGCKTVRTSKTNSVGALVYPNMPFGKYKLCVTGGTEGGKNGVKKELGKKRKYSTTFTNNTTSGPSALATMTDDGGVLKESAAAVYLENGATVNSGAKLEEGTTCP